MVQLTTSVAVAVLLAAPSLAAPFHVGPHAEDHADSHIEAREPRVRAALGKAGKVVTSGRVGAAAEVAAAGATIAATQQTARDLEFLEELVEREPIFGKVFKVAKKVVGGAAKVAAGALSGREFEELEELAARDPRIRAALGKARKAVTSDRVSAGASVVSAGATIAASQQTARDLEELEEFATREPIFGKVFKVAKKVVGGAAKVAAGALSGREFEEMQELALREFDDFEELATREPIFGKVFKVATKVVGGAAKVAAGALASREFEELQELALRDLEDFEEVATREPGSLSGTIERFKKSDADLRAKGLGGSAQLHRREPRVRAALGKARKVVTSGRVGAAAEVAAAGATVHAASQQPAARELDFDELEELAAREPIFGKVFKVAKKVVGGAAKVAAGALAGRDLETIEELAAREYFDSEVDQLD